jgi:hypothetical protein
MGAYGGPMMHYGYCPGARSGADGRAWGWHGPGMMGGGAMMGRGGMMGGDGVDVSAWLDNAKTTIGITAAQETAWSAYVEAAQADRATMVDMHSQMYSAMSAGAHAPDRLQAHIDLMSSRLASLERVQAATRALYEALAPEQRARADQALWSGCW